MRICATTDSKTQSFTYITCKHNSDKMSCFVSFKDAAGCGEFMGQNNLERLSNCKQDVSAHLRRYHLSKENLLEYNLILLRAGFLNVPPSQLENMLVCSRHRGNLGVFWRSRTVRQYPGHKGTQGRAQSADRAFTLKLVQEVNNIFSVIVPIGSRELKAVPIHLRILELFRSINYSMFGSLILLN